MGFFSRLKRLFCGESKTRKAWGKVCSFFKELAKDVKDFFGPKKERKDYVKKTKDYASAQLDVLKAKITHLQDKLDTLKAEYTSKCPKAKPCTSTAVQESCAVNENYGAPSCDLGSFYARKRKPSTYLQDASEEVLNREQRLII